MTVAIPERDERGNRIYDTYNTRFIPPPGPVPPPGGDDGNSFPQAPSRGPGWLHSAYQRSPGQIGTVPVPRPLPGFLGNRKIILASWLISMAVISYDEWHNYGALPRPARLWYTSLTFGLLAAAGSVDAMVPLANAFAIGFTIVLFYQYYGSNGQFAGSGAGSTSAIATAGQQATQAAGSAAVTINQFFRNLF